MGRLCEDCGAEFDTLSARRMHDCPETDPEVVEEREALRVDGQHGAYRFGTSVLSCKGCGAEWADLEVDYTDERREEGVPVMTLATACSTCGETTLHISY